MSDLQYCYDQMKLILGDSIEPFESVFLVEQYRQYWKPEKVKIILLAESHVFTSTDDREIKIPVIDSLPGYPTEYAKFVYCIGYGEKGLTKNFNHPKRDGTPQFWKIFLSCLNQVNSNADFAKILKSQVSFEERIINKIQLLTSLKEKGIWLVDTSICALYHNGKKPSSNVMLKSLKTSWLNYTKKVIANANPEHVIIIGKGVDKNVCQDLKRIMGEKYTVISQPNAHLSAKEHLENYRKYFQICNT